MPAKRDATGPPAGQPERKRKGAITEASKKSDAIQAAADDWNHVTARQKTRLTAQNVGQPAFENISLVCLTIPPHARKAGDRDSPTQFLPIKAANPQQAAALLNMPNTHRLKQQIWAHPAMIPIAKVVYNAKKASYLIGTKPGSKTVRKEFYNKGLFAFLRAQGSDSRAFIKSILDGENHDTELTHALIEKHSKSTGFRVTEAMLPAVIWLNAICRFCNIFWEHFPSDPRLHSNGGDMSAAGFFNCALIALEVLRGFIDIYFKDVADARRRSRFEPKTWWGTQKNQPAYTAWIL